MKKAMLFMIALLFSVGANAASLTLANDTSITGTYGTTGVSLSSDSQRLTWDVNTGTKFKTSAFLTTNKDTNVRVQWTYNPNLISGTTDDAMNVSGLSTYTYTLGVLASKLGGYNLWTEGFTAPSPSTGVVLTVSEVPVPAALWLFAPALLGFFGLRRKSSSQALVAA